MKRNVAVALITLAVATVVNAHEIVRTLTLSKSFADIAGTPRIVRNSAHGYFVVTWRQQASPATIMSRIVNGDGTLGATKVIASGVGAAEHSHDIAYDSDTDTYLLSYETSKGLQVQLLKGNLAKQGSPTTIQAGLKGANARVMYDSDGKRFLIAWVASQGGNRNMLMDRLLKSNGTPTGASHVVAKAQSGRSFGVPSMSRNEKTGIFLVMVMERDQNKGRLQGYNINPDDSLVQPPTLHIEGQVAGFDTIGDATFSDEEGNGLVLWTDHNMLKYRKVAENGTLSSGSKQINNAADANSLQASFAYDEKNEQFVGFWTRGNILRGIAFGEQSGSIEEQPFKVGTSKLSNALNARGAFDEDSGNILAVWEDSSAGLSALGGGSQATYRIRGAVLRAKAGGPGPGTEKVSMGDNFFAPSSLTIKAGTTVVWTNNGVNPHTVTSGTPTSPGTLFDSGTLTMGQTFTFKFENAGTFPYFCRIHASMMTGTIVVTSASSE